MGKVSMEDGSPLPQRVAIKRTCQGTSSRKETYTDSHGTFSFQIGGMQALSTVADASDSTAGLSLNAQATGDPLSQMMGPQSIGLGVTQPLEQQIWSCEVSAELPGYRSDVVSLAGRHVMDDPDIGAIVLHRIGNANSAATISVTSMAAPKDARKEFAKANELLAKGKLEDAQAHAEKAVGEFPQYAEAWYLLGQLHERQKQMEDAESDFHQSMKADSRFMKPYVALAEIEGMHKNWAESERLSAKVMEVGGVFFPGAYFLNAIANYNMQSFDSAERSARRAEELDSQHHWPRIQLLMAMLLEHKGDMAGAATELRSYLKLAPQAEDASDVQKQLAELEKSAPPNSPPQQH